MKSAMSRFKKSPHTKNPYLLVGILLFMIPSRSLAAGTNGGLILNTPVGARAIAMGEAYTAQSDDVSSLYWNPAGIGILNQSQASFLYNQSIQGMSFNNLSVATPLENGGIGASLSYLSYGKIDGYNAQDQPIGNVSAYSGAATVGAAFFSGQSWAGGVNLKGVQGSLAGIKATGMASDFGLTYIHPQLLYDGTLRLAATIRNLGTGLTYIDQKDPFPLEYRMGAAAVQMLHQKLNVSADVGKVRDSRVSGYLGTEYWVVPQIALRGGWVGSDQEGSGLRAGIGIRIKDFSFDYAYSHYGDLGMSNLFEMSVRFGVIRPTLSPEEREILHRAKLAYAHERYGESTLLFNSLLELEPNYRPAKRFLITSMRSFDVQDRQRNAIGKSYNMTVYRGRMDIDHEDPETKELVNLLSEGEETQTAANAASLPSAEASTLAPSIGSVDPQTPLVPERKGAR
jgi:hypothetical protein